MLWLQQQQLAALAYRLALQSAAVAAEGAAEVKAGEGEGLLLGAAPSSTVAATQQQQQEAHRAAAVLLQKQQVAVAAGVAEAVEGVDQEGVLGAV
jgi:hypothetical protein